MNFAEAMDAIGVSAPEVADRLGLTAQTVRQMRLDPENPGYRSPPAAWGRLLAQMARERGGELHGLADELERGGAG